MIPFEDLQGLMSSARPASTPVARRAAALLSFGEFRAAAAAWRRTFAAARGQRFALYFEDSFDFAAALFGLWHAGKCALLPGDALPATLERLKTCVDGFAGDLPDACEPLQPETGPDEEAPWQPLDPQALQLMIFTSGSTGEPAAIPKRLEQMFAEVRALQRAFGEQVAAGEVLATVSHQHIYGLLFRVLWPLAAGRVFHVERLAYVEDIPPQLDAFGPAVVIASPAHLKRLPELRLDAQLLKAVFSSGGPLPDAAVPECIARLGQAPIEVYGSSETGGVAWRQRSETASGEWRALPDVQWRLQDDTLEIRSAHLDKAEWMPTADRAAPTAFGFVLLGRADRVIKIEEKRVSLAAIEQALLATDWLQELRVLSLPGPREQLGIVAVPTDSGWAVHDEIGKKAFASRLRGLLLLQLDASSAPRHWRFVSRLPSNSQGKTTQDALLALFDPRRPQPRILSLSPQHAELRITVDAALPQLDGHFPGHPVLPGVVQLEWAILMGRELFALQPAFLSLEGLKFQQVITPGLTLTLELEFARESGKLSFKYLSRRGQHASGRVLFGPAP